MIDVYGLKNCDSCRKAIRWLDENGPEYRFHDIRKAQLGKETIAFWATQAGWQKLLNRRGTTWRGLPDADKAGIDEARAISLMTAHPALIKRPVFVLGKDICAGFDHDAQAAIFGYAGSTKM